MQDRVTFREVLYVIAGCLLLSAAPIVDAARMNLGRLVWHEFWVTLGVMAGVPALTVAVIAILFPRRLYFAAAAVLVSWMLVHQNSIASGLRSLDIDHAQGAALLGILALFPVAFIVFSFLPRRLVSSIVGAMGCAIFALSAAQLALAMSSEGVGRPDIDPFPPLERHPLPEAGELPRQLPDIIYIVPDRYGSAGVLAEAFGHDNGIFLEALRRRGFAVAERARANYLKTHYSLASSMNVQYIEPLLDEIDGVTRRPDALFGLIENNLVAQRLRKLGYRYVNIGSWWGPTSDSELADRSVDFGLPDFGGNFGRAVFQRSPVTRWILDQIDPLDLCASLRRQLSHLESAGGDRRPTFVFAHVIAPHDPIVTDANGNCIPPMRYPGQPPGVTWAEFKAAYADYVTYLNRRFLEIFDRQRATNPNPLIFVLQADEGPFPRALRDADLPGAEEFDWREASDADLATKFGILNALYLGEPEDMAGLPEVSDTLSPVNNWRIIFSHLEGVAHPLLPERQFIFPTSSQPYRSIEITEHLSTIP